MSSIPVKKGGSAQRRSGIPKGNVGNENNNEVSSDSRVATKHSGKENKIRPFLRQGSKKELEDENTRLNDLIQVHEQKLKELDSKVVLTEEELTKATIDACKVNEKWEKKLLTCNIDPVTMTKITPNSQQENEIQKHRETSKVQVRALKEKMQQLNSWAETCISDLEDISSQLEASSEVS